MTRVEMLEEITRFRCHGCGKKADVKGYDNRTTRPPRTWRWIETNTFRARPSDPDYHGECGVVCSIGCAASVAARSWDEPDEA